MSKALLKPENGVGITATPQKIKRKEKKNMSLKKQEKENETTNEIQAYQPANPVQVESAGELLPSMKITYPIQNLEKSYFLRLLLNGREEWLDEPYLVSTIAARVMIRKLDRDEGNYIRYYKPWKGADGKEIEGSTSTEYRGAVGNGDFETGNSYVVALFRRNDAEPLIVNMEAFKAETTYWSFLNDLKSQFTQGKGVWVKVIDHKKNTEESKKNKGRFYLSAQRFNNPGDWEFIELTEDQIDAISQAMSNQKQALETWFRK